MFSSIFRFIYLLYLALKEKAIKIISTNFQFVLISIKFLLDRIADRFKYCNKLYFQTDDQESKLQSHQNSLGQGPGVRSYEQSLFFSLSGVGRKILG